MNALIKYDAYPNLRYWLSTYVDNISYSDFFSIYIRLTIKNPIDLTTRKGLLEFKKIANELGLRIPDNVVDLVYEEKFRNE